MKLRLFTGAEKHRAFGVVTPEHRHGARGQRFNDQQVRDGLAYDFDREREGVRCGVGLGGGRKGIFIRPIDVRNRTVTFAQDHDDCVGSRMSYSVTPERRYGDQGQGRGDRRGRDFDVGQERGGGGFSVFEDGAESALEYRSEPALGTRLMPPLGLPVWPMRRKLKETGKQRGLKSQRVMYLEGIGPLSLGNKVRGSLLLRLT